ncbi:MAG TPA: heavy metal translocating P-type ATPase metal-binding domain-containing protein, partial [Xanthomonadales bacterium]|nr:heavy metal translocating P-type ATPase metal-binding domain-containing protein [Xanthomonadales bacterium]
METAEASNSQSGCFHCGEAIPAGLDLEIDFAGKRHRVCCAGCQAVFQSIAGAGLDRYYQFRQALGRKVTGDMQSRQQAWQAVDDRESLWGVPNEKGWRDLQLQTEGIRCAACAWLIRSQLESARGIQSVQVNLGTGYTRIEWDPEQTRLSKIAMTLFGLGYVPHLPITSEEEKGRRQEQRNSLKRLGVAGLGMMQVMMYAVGLYTGDAMGMSPASRGFLTWVSLLVTLPVVLYSGRVFFISAWQGVRMGRPGMDLPVAIAIGIAFIASCYNFFLGQGEVWFDSVVMFIFFLTLGRHVEMVLRHRNVQAGTALARLLPEWANKVDAAELRTVPAIDLVAGDQVRVAPNEIIPADGKILRGNTRVDEALLTGESRPLVREPGNDVIAGTRNLEQPIEVIVT